ncbi:MAG TPA: beta-ketoacyl-ACP synthase [Candidatus Binatia bacterium]|nr:beta-ketoacyl-ACP synthase [Candidatus Binatia bacterium]
MTRTTQPCRLAALGMISALGNGPTETWPRLIGGDTSRLVRRSDLVPDQELILGMVGDALPQVPEHLREFDCRNNRLLLAALDQIAAPISAAVERFGRARIAVVAGTSTAGVADAEEAIRHQVRTGNLPERFRYAQLEFGGTSDFIAAYLGTTGPAYTLSTACSSGARALASARSLVAMGIADAVVCGAADTLCGVTANGFSSLGVVAPELTNPCSLNRRGLTLGEAAAFFLVTRDEGGIQLVGVGESSEAHHMSSPDPEGAGARAAMQAALADAGLAATDIAYLNLHGTGTSINDSMESLAVAEVLGGSVPVSSTKTLVGHTLGAAGAIEAAFCWQILDDYDGRELSLPPHRWDGIADPALPALDLVEAGRRACPREVARVMTNSFGFGGNNCTLILERRAAPATTARPSRSTALAEAPGPR